MTKSRAIGAVAVSVVLVLIVLGLFHLRQGADVRGGESASEDPNAVAGTQMRRSAGRSDEFHAASIDTAEIDCEKQLSELANNSEFMAQQMQRRVRSHLRSLSDRGFGKLERALVAEAAGLRCVTSTCYEHVSLRDAPRLRTVFDAYSLPSETSDWSDKASKKPAFRVIADAIEDDMRAFEFDMLLSSAQTDLNATWQDYKTRQRVNLAVFAALLLRPDHLRALLRHGASPVLEERSALDDLAFKLPLPVPREDQLIDIVRQLAQAGDRAFSPHALSLLEQLIPDVPGLDLHPRTQRALAAANLESASTELATLVTAWEHDIDAAVRLERRCAERGRTAVDHTSLAAKMRHEESWRQRQEAFLQRMREDAPELEQRMLEMYKDHAEAFDVYLKGLEAVLDAIAERRWEDAIALADEWYPVLGPSVPQFEDMLSRALQYGAPLDVLGQLIDRAGGVLPPDAIMKLVRFRPTRADLDALLELEMAHGLNIHFVNDDGRNAMNSLARYFWGIPEFAARDEPVLQIARHLGKRGITAKPSPVGFDPLDTILSELVELPGSAVGRAEFVRILLAAGAPLERSHFELIGRLRELHPDAYHRFVDIVPELARPS